MNKKLFSKIWNAALQAGEDSGKKCTPVPMVVEQHTDMINDNSPVKQSWFVADGCCGFAWVTIRPGNCAFANWLKEKGFAKHDSYYGGVTYWVNYGNQSIARKEAFAEAMVDYLLKYSEDLGTNRIYSQSRLD